MQPTCAKYWPQLMQLWQPLMLDLRSTVMQRALPLFAAVLEVLVVRV